MLLSKSTNLRRSSSNGLLALSIMVCLALARSVGAATAEAAQPPTIPQIEERVSRVEGQLRDFTGARYHEVEVMRDEIHRIREECDRSGGAATPDAARRMEAQVRALEKSAKEFLRGNPARTPPPSALLPTAGASPVATQPAASGAATAGSTAPAPVAAEPQKPQAPDCGLMWAAAKREVDGGNPVAAYGKYVTLAAMTCSDTSIVDEARAFVAAHPARAAESSTVGPVEASRSRATPTSAAARVPAVASAQPMRSLTLDVWQSAWGGFSERDLDQLVAWAKRNGITAVNLNPGDAMSPSTVREANPTLKRVVGRLETAGLKVNYLYAELNYDIGNYARFLRLHPELGITTIVDDSEYTDAAQPAFERNRDAVRAHRLAYSAFITLETLGNSGVSDEVRTWGIEHIDEPILMSYFSCNLQEQQAILRPYFEFAETLEHRGTGFLKVAVLLGSKSVGRERSCEQELDEGALQTFLRELDDWCRRYHSYGGIVLETNQRLPRNVER